MTLFAGRYFGIPLFFHWTFLITAALSYQILDFYLITIFFLILHEYGHCFAARKFNIPVNDVTIYFFGGLASIQYIPVNAKKEFLIALAGPAVNLFFFMVFLPIAILEPASEEIAFAQICVISNFMLGVSNLSPIFPLDGGRILRSILHFITKDYYKSTWYTVIFSQFACFNLIILTLFYQLWFLAIVFGLLLVYSQAELRRVEVWRCLAEVRIWVAKQLERPELETVSLPILIEELKAITDETTKKKLNVDNLIPTLESFLGEEI